MSPRAQTTLVMAIVAASLVFAALQANEPPDRSLVRAATAWPDEGDGVDAP